MTTIRPGEFWIADIRFTATVVGLVSFAIRRRLGIMEAFTNDQHFPAAGFTTLF